MSGCGSKVCRGCGESKPLEEFHVCRERVDGRQSKCKECQRAAVARSRAKKVAAYGTPKELRA